MFQRRYIILVPIALLILGAVFYFVFSGDRHSIGKSGTVLELRDSGSARIFGARPLDETGEFSIEFIHSVNMSPVRETFIIDGRMIRPLSVRFSSFGAGMQSDLEPGQKLGRDGDFMVITGFSSSFRELNYIVGTVSDHLLYINGETISLRELCGRNAHVTIRLRK